MNWSDNLSIARHLLFLMRSEWWPESRIRRYQEDRLIRILRHATTSVPFYRSLGIDPETICSGKDIERFPIIRKQDIQDHAEEILDPSYNKETLYVSRTSGSTCEPTSTYFDPAAWIFSKYSLKIRRVCSAGNPLFKRLLIVTHQSDEILEGENRNRLKGSRLLFQEKQISLFDSIEKHIPVFMKYKPDIINSFPSYLLELASYIRNEKVQAPIIPVIFTSSELLTTESRKVIEEAFGGRVYDLYGSTEFKEVACQCENGRYHINYEHVYLENKVTDGGDYVRQNNLIITGMTNYAMPLIRFDIGDQGELGWGSCRCGRNSPYLKGIYGRETDLVSLPSGRRISPYILTTAIEEDPSIRKYQIIQGSPSELMIDYIPYDKAITDGKLNVMINRLKALLKEPVRVTFNRVNYIERSKSGKYRIIKRLFDA